MYFAWLSGVWNGLVSIAKAEGITGLWRGANTAIPRIGVVSSSQLFAFAKTKDWLVQFGVSSSHILRAISRGDKMLYCRESFQQNIPHMREAESLI